MAVKDQKMIPQYFSDIPNLTFRNVPFAITANMDDCVLYPDRTGACGCPVNFKMRALIATFDDPNKPERKCLQVRFPVPSVEQIVPITRKLKDCGAICINLDGEEWDILPPKIGSINYTPSYDLIVLEGGRFSPKLSGRMAEYNSDINAEQIFRPKVAIEVDPIGLASIILGETPELNPNTNLYTPSGNESGCTGKIIEANICTLATTTPRYITMRGNSTSRTSSSAQRKIPKNFVRKAPVRDTLKIPECITNISNGFEGIHCFGYKGESIERIDILV